MGNRLAVRRKFTNLAAKENSVHFVKRRGQSGRKSVAERPSEPIRIYLIKFWARVKEYRISQTVKALSASQRSAIGSRRPWPPSFVPTSIQLVG